VLLLIGYVVILAASVGTYAVHGSLAALFVPLEYLAIVGLMTGGFIAGNGSKAIKATLAALPSVLKGSHLNKALYMELLAMLYEILAKVRKEGLMSIESDIENPEGSAIFGKYPTVTADHHVMEFITDYLRMMVGGNLNAFEIENLMDLEIETHHQEAHLPAHIMAVAPIASQLEQKAEEGGKIYQCIKAVLLASMNGYAPQVAVEFGRKVLFSGDRPSFSELEEDLKARKGK